MSESSGVSTIRDDLTRFSWTIKETDRGSVTSLSLKCILLRSHVNVHVLCVLLIFSSSIVRIFQKYSFFVSNMCPSSSLSSSQRKIE